MIHDITPLITEKLAVFPGDTPASRRVLMDMAKGDNITLSTLNTTVHLGAHADAPLHYGKDATPIASMPLDLYLGPCQVITPRAVSTPAYRLTPDDIETEITEQRVLIHTGSYPDPRHFNTDFTALSTELIEHFADLGVRLIGIDTPSVDPAEARDLTAHHTFLARNVAILEGIVLTDVPDGRYELIALPLKLAGFDASPVRAVLREL
ncbi:MAG: cyclase family protein [Phycisphaerales bacterium]